MQETEEHDRMGMTRDCFKKTGEIKGTLHARMGIIMGRNSKDLREVEEIKEVARIHRIIQERP